ncbi:MAG: energy transducer TonB [Pyrinomonadaceae bacterium]
MFDKLIVSEPERAEFKSRRSYFLVSSVVVGILFGTAVIISIFAADYRLGASEFELVELIAPPNMTAMEPEPPRLQISEPRSSSSASPSKVPMLKDPVANMIESPNEIPTISVARNTYVSRPLGAYEVGPADTKPGNGSGRTDLDEGSGPTGLVASVPAVEEMRTIPEPPPVRDPPPARPPAPRSMGVINGMATSLPKPNYPAAAKAINLQGKVDVQVLIDETGRVVSAKAINGNALLQSAAVSAARNARFTPTLLSRVPVKVTGVIVYNFNRI